MTHRSRPTRLLRLGAAALLGATCLSTMLAAQQRPAPRDVLLDGFVDPPQAARPRVWWHWMNGNISKEGIRKDLAWMRRSGIGGVQNFDANLVTPQVVDKRLIYMTPEWRDAFRYSAELADNLGLELAVAASPGWSETGGPWVPPVDAMKKLTWSDTIVDGGQRFAGRLAAPPTTTGPFGAVALDDPLAKFEGRGGKAPPVFYTDVAVLAYPIARNPAASAASAKTATGPADAALLSDGDYGTGVEVPKGSADGAGALTLAYPRARTIRSAAIFILSVVPPFGDPATTPLLEAEGPGGWRRVAELPVGDVPTTVAFAPVTASRFRVVLGPYTGLKRPGLGAGAPGAAPPPFNFGAPPTSLRVTELRLAEEDKVHRFEAKAGFQVAGDYYALGGVGLPEHGAVAPDRVIDLTGRMRPDGALDWTPPPGRWRVVRLGASLTGKTNHPATPEATGLEVDKFDGAAVRRYLDHYLGLYRGATGAGLMGVRGLRAIVTDSTEVGAANWTPRLFERFRELRGYDPRPWLPTIAGTVIGSRARSDAFLYDWRRTLAELHASEHYGTVAAVAHENGLKVYGEALEDQRPSLGDDMQMRRYADVPMAAMWTYKRGDTPRPTLLGDIRGAASVAHLYGQNLVAAESLTSAMSPWAHAPADLRRVVDLEFAHGVNRPVIHTSVHQPVDDKQPGLSLAIFGQYFNRHETWAEMARPWVDYLARTSHLLQQGRFFADVAYFHGEEAPLTALYGQVPLADTPRRHAFDFVNADALLNLLTVEGGDLAAPSGARYRLLYLGGTSRRMTLPVLRRLASLAEQGATIVGDPPVDSPALDEDTREYRDLVRRLWSGRELTELGRGRVIASRDVNGALRRIGVGPDFTHSGGAADAELLFVHRRLEDGDLYFVNNRRDRPERVEARFRVTGRAPEIWRADTGTAEPISYRVENGETVVPLSFEAEESFFVVFRKPAASSSVTVAAATPKPFAELDGPWTVQFQSERGAPASMTLPELGSLHAQTRPGVKYFSGVATYARTFTAPTGHLPGRPLLLDLGAVGDIAEVRINGRSVGTVWHAPYLLDIDAAVRRGRNRLEIRVANLWANRLIGDAQPGATRITFTTLPTYTPDAPLRPSGLIGPVRLLRTESTGR